MKEFEYYGQLPVERFAASFAGNATKAITTTCRMQREERARLSISADCRGHDEAAR